MPRLSVTLPVFVFCCFILPHLKPLWFLWLRIKPLFIAFSSSSLFFHLCFCALKGHNCRVLRHLNCYDHQLPFQVMRETPFIQPPTFLCLDRTLLARRYSLCSAHEQRRQSHQHVNQKTRQVVWLLFLLSPMSLTAEQLARLQWGDLVFVEVATLPRLCSLFPLTAFHINQQHSVSNEAELFDPAKRKCWKPEL